MPAIFFSGGEGDEGVGIGVGVVEVSSGSVEMMESVSHWVP